jgi:hypothetical protein
VDGRNTRRGDNAKMECGMRIIGMSLCKRTGKKERKRI